MYSVPEHITMFGTGAALVGSVYPMIMAHTGGQGIPCPLRTLTGVPCPFCGMTTATVALTHGEWATAARTSPLAYLAAGLVVATAPGGTRPLDALRATPLWREMPAVRAGRVFPIPAALPGDVSQRAADAPAAIARQLHPERWR